MTIIKQGHVPLIERPSKILKQFRDCMYAPLFPSLPHTQQHVALRTSLSFNSSHTRFTVCRYSYQTVEQNLQINLGDVFRDVLLSVHSIRMSLS
jgi:hypothetical protein